jgi:glycine/D-amino acid oxidase-like deaminating enzyme
MSSIVPMSASSPFERSWSEAATVPFWLDRHDAPEPAEALAGDTDADLVVVGGGFTGLWTAIQARELDPTRDVVLLEQDTVAFGASGRNGGFCVASLTHGIDNGLARFADELAVLERLGLENFAGLRADLVTQGSTATSKRPASRCRPRSCATSGGRPARASATAATSSTTTG